MLVVMLIITLVVGFSTSALRSLVEGDHLQRAIIGITSTLEATRQSAIANGTYTWVGMNSERSSKTGQNAVVVAAFTSKIGTRGADFTNGTDMRLLSKVEKFDAVTLQQTPPAGSGLSQQMPSVSSKNSPSDSQFRPRSDDLPDAYRNVDFDWVVIFNPRGEAAIDSDTGMSDADADSLNFTEAIEFTVVSSKGNTPSSMEEKSAAAIRVDGLTGQVEIYRPEATGH